MKNRIIFPVSVLNQSTESVLGEKGPSGVLYLTVILSVAAAFLASFDVTVSVNAQAVGIIRPRQDHIAVSAGASGYCSACPFQTDSHVERGDTLFVVRPDLVLVQLPALKQRQRELRDMTSDLIDLSNGVYTHMRSNVCSDDLRYYLSLRDEAVCRLEIAEKAYERSRKLSDAGLIPLSDFETVEGQMLEARGALESLETRQMLQWRSDLEKYVNELRDVDMQIDDVSVRASQTVVLSPADGTVVQMQPVTEGTYVTSGQCLMEISPDGDLIAECHVDAMDIGYFHEGMHGRLQVAAYKYTEWGMLDVTVMEISDDIALSQDGTESYYRVYCRLESDHLSLKNGTVGPLMKGMAVNGNFIITRRTVFQLLYDRIDDWINPNTANNE